MSYFPMYVELCGKDCLVVGGGKVALRKVEKLREFGAKLFVISPEILPELAVMEGVICQKRQFQKTDLEGKELVVAATDDEALNHRISQACRAKKIPVNAVDQKEDCSFIFPAYVKEGEVVAAFSSGGQSPVITQYLKEQIRPAVTPHLSDLAVCLGSLREMVRQCTKTEAARKKIYKEILALGLKKDAIPSEQEIAEIIGKYQ